jgi:hypothetical protein
MLCTVAAMILAFAYRCGGSDGIAGVTFDRRTVFPFNPRTEQSRGHLQTRAQGAVFAFGSQRLSHREALSKRGIFDFTRTVRRAP